jgi:hypothetical protein
MEVALHIVQLKEKNPRWPQNTIFFLLFKRNI